jgi:hypothetical protein
MVGYDTMVVGQEGGRYQDLEKWLEPELYRRCWRCSAWGVLLYAAAKTHDRNLEEACLRLFRKRWKPNLLLTWLAPIAGLHLGFLTEDQVRTTLSPPPILRSRQLCQLDFHMGVLSLRKGLLEESARRMCSAADQSDALLQVERYLAMVAGY